MDILIKGAEGFIGLFRLGAATFMSWMTGIVPIVLILMVFMNVVIKLIGEDKINSFAQKTSKYSLVRNCILPFLAAFMLGNPASFTLGRFLPEFYKPSYLCSACAIQPHK